MCFCASVSLILSGFLFYIGYLTVTKVQKAESKFFASIPFIFATQQLAEGIIWLTANKFPLISLVATYFFLLSALVVWPIWIPFSIYYQERKYNIREMLFWLCIIGALISLFFLFTIIKNGVHSKILCNHIYYHIAYYSFSFFDASILYLIPIILPFFLTSTPRMKIFGSFLLVFCLISYFIWSFFFTSFWCFFAAILSLFTYLII